MTSVNDLAASKAHLLGQLNEADNWPLTRAGRKRAIQTLGKQLRQVQYDLSKALKEPDAGKSEKVAPETAGDPGESVPPEDSPVTASSTADRRRVTFTDPQPSGKEESSEEETLRAKTGLATARPKTSIKEYYKARRADPGLTMSDFVAQNTTAG